MLFVVFFSIIFISLHRIAGKLLSTYSYCVKLASEVRAGKGGFSGHCQNWPSEIGSQWLPMLNVLKSVPTYFGFQKAGSVSILAPTSSVNQYLLPAFEKLSLQLVPPGVSAWSWLTVTGSRSRPERSKLERDGPSGDGSADH